MAASLPAPGPLIRTSTCLRPWSIPLRAACSAALWAAKAVPLRDPRNPDVPALDEARTLPWGSVRVTRVLLKVEWIKARPLGTAFLSLRRLLGLAMSLLYFLAPVRRPRPATVFLGPLRVRALVRVLCPRSGSPRRCRRPRKEPISMSLRMLALTSRRRSPSTL